MQDSTKIVLASTMSNVKDVECFPVDPATFLAGLCVSMGSDGFPALAKGNGRIGVSLGRSLSEVKKTSVCRTGLKVGIRAAAKRSTGVITVSSYANLLTTTPDSVTVGASVFVAQSGAATPGTLFFQAATSNNATATSLAAQINSHATASTLVYAVANGAAVTLYAKAKGTATGNDVAVAYTDNGGGNIGITLSGLTGGKLAGGADSVDYAVDGQKMYVNDVTGEADVAMTGFSTITDAIYRPAYSLPGQDPGCTFTGIDEDGNSVLAVLVDMAGGL